MVGESQSLGARGYRVVDRPLGGRVAPARLLRILRNRVLRIVNDEVRVRKEIDVTLVLLVPRWLTLGSCRRVRGMRLVIHRIHNHIGAGLQAIAQRGALPVNPNSCCKRTLLTFTTIPSISYGRLSRLASHSLTNVNTASMSCTRR